MRVERHLHVIVHVLLVYYLYPHRLLTVVDVRHSCQTAPLQQKVTAEAVAGAYSRQRRLRCRQTLRQCEEMIVWVMDACREMAQLREGLQAIVERKEPLLVTAQPEPDTFFLHLLHKCPGYAVVVVEIGG